MLISKILLLKILAKKLGENIMQRRNNSGFDSVLNNINDLLKNEHITAFEKNICKFFEQSSLMSSGAFPKTDTYTVYKDKDKKELEKIQLYIYLAGYRKEDISIEFNESQRLLVIKGEIKDKKYFPESETVIRVTNNASAKKFRVNHRLSDYDVGDVSMEDGVLIVDFIPIEDKTTTKINIK
jgi:HSP20 family molecular chaperone IbpA